jgi:hypothetical protein
MRGAAIAVVVGVVPYASLGCGDDGGGHSCGPGSASPTGLAMTATVGSDFTFGSLMEGANNDCTPTGSGVISVTIQGTQVGGTGFVALCVPRPNEFGDPLAVGSDDKPDEPPVILVSLAVSTPDGCFYNLPPGMQVSGTAHAVGLCDDGAGSAGFALVIDATTALTGSGSDAAGSACVGQTNVELAGSAAVAPML